MLLSLGVGGLQWNAPLPAITSQHPAPPPLRGRPHWLYCTSFGMPLQVLEQGLLMAGESGIFTPDDVAFVQLAGCGAILVGESLVKQGDPASGVKQLLSLM